MTKYRTSLEHIIMHPWCGILLSKLETPELRQHILKKKT